MYGRKTNTARTRTHTIACWNGLGTRAAKSHNGSLYYFLSILLSRAEHGERRRSAHTHARCEHERDREQSPELLAPRPRRHEKYRANLDNSCFLFRTVPLHSWCRRGSSEGTRCTSTHTTAHDRQWRAVPNSRYSFPCSFVSLIPENREIN